LASDGTEDKESEDWDGSEEEEDDEDVDMVSPVVVGTGLDAHDAAASR